MLISARFVISVLLVTCYLLPVTSRPAFAQTNQAYPPTQQANPYTAPNTNPDVPKNLHTWTQSVVIELSSALLCQLVGINPSYPHQKQKCLGIDQRTGNIGFVENGGGAIGMMGSMITMLYTPPAHFSDFTRDMAQNFGFAKPAYAQSIGMQGLSPLTKVWKAFLNITYLLFVIVFIVIGFAIMLRIKIDPRTVMSIENQIPKLIVALLLSTFSLAIAGLMIDLMYVSIYLIFNIFIQIGVGYNLPNGTSLVEGIQKVQNVNNGANVFQTFGDLVGYFRIVTYGAGAVKDIVMGILTTGATGQPPTSIAQGSASFLQTVGTAISNFFSWFGQAIPNLLGAFTSYLIGLFAGIVIAVAVLFSLFRVWFMLLKAYIGILANIALAPFWIVFGVIPGSATGFGSWFRSLLANLAIFPATIGLFLLAATFMSAFKYSGNPNPSQMFVPPMIGNLASAQDSIANLIGLGFILLAPSVLAMVRDTLKVEAFKYSSSIGQALTGGASVPTRLASGGMETAFGQQWEITGAGTTPIPLWRRGLRAAGLIR